MTKVITTNSFRGGTGKTTIVSNLSSYLASFGYKVIIVDADIISPGIHAVFGLNSKNFQKTLTDYLRDTAKIEETIYDISENLSLEEGSLLLVPASIDKGDIADLLSQKSNNDKLLKALKKLKKEFNPDFIFLDTHPGLNSEVLLVFDQTDILLNIIRPDNQDYQGLEVSSQVASKLKIKQFVILNKVHKKIKNKALKQKIEKTFKVKVAGMLHESEQLILSQSQFIFTDKYPEHEFSREIYNIAQEVFEIKPRKHLELMRFMLNVIKKEGPAEMEKLRKNKKVYKHNAEKYLQELIQNSFIYVDEKKGKNVYSITPKGLKFLKKYEIINRFVDGFRI